jgi:hypothetical protein
MSRFKYETGILRQNLHIVTETCCGFCESFEERLLVLPFKYTVTVYDIFLYIFLSLVDRASRIIFV